MEDKKQVKLKQKYKALCHGTATQPSRPLTASKNVINIQKILFSRCSFETSFQKIKLFQGSHKKPKAKHGQKNPHQTCIYTFIIQKWKHEASMIRSKLEKCQNTDKNYSSNNWRTNKGNYCNACFLETKTCFLGSLNLCNWRAKTFNKEKGYGKSNMDDASS